MQSLERKAIELDPKDYIRRSATESDCSELIDYSAKIFSPDGELLVVYETEVDADWMQAARDAMRKAKFGTNTRSNGMKTHSKIFGYAPRHGMRRHPCRLAGFNTDQPQAAQALEDAAKFLNQWYKANSPSAHRVHEETIEKVLPDWRIGETVFTSGIANKNNTLDYHFDAGNFKDCRSVMIGFRERCGGGLLSVPQLDIKFDIGDCSIISFDGQILIHGVTPLLMRRGGFRFTAVYYALRQMWDCAPITKEIIEFRKKMDELARDPHWDRHARGQKTQVGKYREDGQH